MGNKIPYVSTGIVRRVDDLGRIVIPKEVRRKLAIGEGDPLEFFVSDNGSIILHKYGDDQIDDGLNLLKNIMSEREYDHRVARDINEKIDAFGEYLKGCINNG